MKQIISKILLVEHDATLAELLKDYLCLEGFEVSHTQDSTDAQMILRDGYFDILLLDVMLPDVESFQFLQVIRQISKLPIILLTDGSKEYETIQGLELGADDFISKPFNIRELLARIRANLRREKFAQQTYGLLDLKAGPLTIERKTRTARYHNCTLRLTDTEYSILELLVLNSGGVVTKETLSQQIFKRVLEKYDRSIDMHMSNLRKKLSEGSPQESIKTIRGAGYMMLI